METLAPGKDVDDVFANLEEFLKAYDEFLDKYGRLTPYQVKAERALLHRKLVRSAFQTPTGGNLRANQTHVRSLPRKSFFRALGSRVIRVAGVAVGAGSTVAAVCANPPLAGALQAASGLCSIAADEVSDGDDSRKARCIEAQMFVAKTLLVLSRYSSELAPIADEEIQVALEIYGRAIIDGFNDLELYLDPAKGAARVTQCWLNQDKLRSVRLSIQEELDNLRNLIDLKQFTNTIGPEPIHKPPFQFFKFFPFEDKTSEKAFAEISHVDQFQQPVNHEKVGEEIHEVYGNVVANIFCYAKGGYSLGPHPDLIDDLPVSIARANDRVAVTFFGWNGCHDKVEKLIEAVKEHNGHGGMLCLVVCLYAEGEADPSTVAAAMSLLAERLQRDNSLPFAIKKASSKCPLLVRTPITAAFSSSLKSCLPLTLATGRTERLTVHVYHIETAAELLNVAHQGDQVGASSEVGSWAVLVVPSDGERQAVGEHCTFLVDAAGEYEMKTSNWAGCPRFTIEYWEQASGTALVLDTSDEHCEALLNILQSPLVAGTACLEKDGKWLVRFDRVGLGLAVEFLDSQGIDFGVEWVGPGDTLLDLASSIYTAFKPARSNRRQCEILEAFVRNIEKELRAPDAVRHVTVSHTEKLRQGLIVAGALLSDCAKETFLVDFGERVRRNEQFEAACEMLAMGFSCMPRGENLASEAEQDLKAAASADLAQVRSELPSTMPLQEEYERPPVSVKKEGLAFVAAEYPQLLVETSGTWRVSTPKPGPGTVATIKLSGEPQVQFHGSPGVWERPTELFQIFLQASSTHGTLSDVELRFPESSDKFATFISACRETLQREGSPVQLTSALDQCLQRGDDYIELADTRDLWERLNLDAYVDENGDAGLAVEVFCAILNLRNDEEPGIGRPAVLLGRMVKVWYDQLSEKDAEDVLEWLPIARDPGTGYLMPTSSAVENVTVPLYVVHCPHNGSVAVEQSTSKVGIRSTGIVVMGIGGRGKKQQIKELRTRWEPVGKCVEVFAKVSIMYDSHNPRDCAFNGIHPREVPSCADCLLLKEFNPPGTREDDYSRDLMNFSVPVTTEREIKVTREGSLDLNPSFTVHGVPVKVGGSLHWTTEASLKTTLVYAPKIEHIAYVPKHAKDCAFAWQQ